MPVCAIYARVSDEVQLKGDSIQHQIAFCQEIARRRATETGETWTVDDARLYVDEGITGTSLIKRAEVQRLIRDARAHRFDVVLFKGISRFARDTVDALVMLRTLLACGVRVLSIEENFDSDRDRAEFVFTIHSALAQAESEKTAIRVRMGTMQKARQGKWNGPAPEGYLLDGSTKKLVIDSQYATVIAEIFHLYAQGYGVRKIASLLNDDHRYTKQGYQWTHRRIARVLTNPVYAGDVVYGRRERKLAMPTEDNFLSRRKMTVWTENPDHIVICRDAHPAIVPRELFNQVAFRMSGRRRAATEGHSIHLLSGGLLRCDCGRAMGVHYNTRSTRYYRCPQRAKRGSRACDQRLARADEIEKLILDRVRIDVCSTLRSMTLRAMTPQSTVLQSTTLQSTTLHSNANSEDVRTMMSVENGLHSLLSMTTPDLQATRRLLQLFVDEIRVQGTNIAISYTFACVASNF